MIPKHETIFLIRGFNRIIWGVNKNSDNDVEYILKTKHDKVVAENIKCFAEINRLNNQIKRLNDELTKAVDDDRPF